MSAAAPVVVGVDFDNTIVCYDLLFHVLACERGMIPADVPVSKEAVRDYLRGSGKEDEWTLLQGFAYGSQMHRAEMFPGVRDAFAILHEAHIPTYIISHKTRIPFAGPAYDLHGAASEWLEQQGFFDPGGAGLGREQVFFELTKQDKLARIAAQGCTVFIDDLPEFLSEPAFPSAVRRILFDPLLAGRRGSGFEEVGSWQEALGALRT